MGLQNGIAKFFDHMNKIAKIKLNDWLKAKNMKLEF
jgi:hypothetical protein